MQRSGRPTPFGVDSDCVSNRVTCHGCRVSATRLAVFDLLEGWYNPHRRHSALDYESRRYEFKHRPPAA
jgi:hypothetical protein